MTDREPDPISAEDVAALQASDRASDPDDGAWTGDIADAEGPIGKAYLAELERRHRRAWELRTQAKLSPRECEVMRHFTLGTSHRGTIANAMGIGESSVRTYIGRIGQKTGVPPEGFAAWFHEAYFAG